MNVKQVKFSNIMMMNHNFIQIHLPVFIEKYMFIKNTQAYTRFKVQTQALIQRSASQHISQALILQ